MADSFIPRMDWEAGDPSQALKLFKQKCELYFSVKDVKKEKQVDHILLFSGEPGLKFYNSWGLQGDDQKDPLIVWQRLETQIEPKTNFRVARLFLQRLKQEDGESMDDYVSRVKLQALKCNFRDDQEFNERVIEQVIIGTCHPEVQKELLAKDKTLSLDQTLDVGRTHEASVQHMKQLKSVQPENVAQAVHYVKRNTKADKTCTRCGYEAHSRKHDCPALGSTCSVCGKPNHWSTVCRLAQNRDHTGPMQRNQGKRQAPQWTKPQDQRNRQQRPHRPNRTVHAMTQDEEDEFSELTIGTIQVASVSAQDTRDEAFTYIKTKVGKKVLVNLRVKVDTGAQGNTLPVRLYQQMFPDAVTAEGLPQAGKLTKSGVVLTAYNGTTIKQHGYVELPCRYQDSHWVSTKFLVVESEGLAIIGLPSSSQLKLVTLHWAINTDQKEESVQDLVKLYQD